MRGFRRTFLFLCKWKAQLTFGACPWEEWATLDLTAGGPIITAKRRRLHVTNLSCILEHWQRQQAYIALPLKALNAIKQLQTGKICNSSYQIIYWRIYQWQSFIVQCSLFTIFVRGRRSLLTCSFLLFYLIPNHGVTPTLQQLYFNALLKQKATVVSYLRLEHIKVILLINIDAASYDLANEIKGSGSSPKKSQNHILLWGKRTIFNLGIYSLSLSSRNDYFHHKERDIILVFYDSYLSLFLLMPKKWH